MDKPLLQIALDTYDLPSALGPLQKAHQYIDVIEVGTILCLAEGMHAVRIIRSLYPDKTILADVRIAEAGSIISKMAFEAGADWVSVVSGAAPTLTSPTAPTLWRRAARCRACRWCSCRPAWRWARTTASPCVPTRRRR
ncbi:MAG: orotidine 5'-phosphate decarboxylase, partial [Anaerolineae bacterium]|nr:orotidine 5'-phosphate decarboxylase [Anaerolineae bacterium]